MNDFGKELAVLLRTTTEQTMADELERVIESQAAGARTRALSPALAPLQRTPALGATAATSSKTGASEGSGTTRTVVNAVLDGMGLSPVLRGLFSLFGGGDEEPLPPLPRYAAPSAVSLNAGIRRSSSSPVAIDYGQAGETREFAAPGPQVVVNVNAMDTQSFLDRSDDIAQAVKRALLE